MKKIFSLLSSLLFVTAVKAQTTVKKETVNPTSSQTSSVSVSAKDAKVAPVDHKKEETAKLAALMAAKDAKHTQKTNVKELPIKDAKVGSIDYKKEDEAKLAAIMAAKEAKHAQKMDPKTLPIKDPKGGGDERKKEEAANKNVKEAKVAKSIEN